MSGTRSPSRKAPATEQPQEALLIVAHGDCGGAGDNRLADALAAHLRRSGRFSAVGVGYIRCGQPFEEVAAEMAADRLRVLPLLMSDGYYARQAIPQRLGKAGTVAGQAVIETPLGLHPDLPALIARESAAALTAAGVEPSGARLLLVAHGSKQSGASAAAARWLATLVAERQTFLAVEVAFLEEAPFLDEQLETLGSPLCIFGLFVGDGMHGGEDLSRAVEHSKRTDLVLAPALADCEAVMEMIASALQT